MWRSIILNIANIETETEKAFLIKMPNRSLYAGYAFWYPKRFVQKIDGAGKHMSLSFGDDFMFSLIKKGKGKRKFDVIEKIDISPSSLEKAFNHKK